MEAQTIRGDMIYIMYIRGKMRGLNMLIRISESSGKPIYQQIRDEIVAAIAAGRLEEGAVLLSARKLGKELGVNYHTVNKAYNLLSSEGFVVLDSKKRVVVEPHELVTDEFKQKWRQSETMKIREGLAHGLSKGELKRLFAKFLEEA